MTVLFAAIGILLGNLQPPPVHAQGAVKAPVIQLEAKEYSRTAPLEIKADGTVVDGKGATFKAAGTTVGIHIGAFKDVTIKNIKLVGFSVGLSAESASGLNVTGVAIVGADAASKSSNSIGIKLEKVSDSALTALDVNGCSTAVALTGCTKVTVEKSDLSHNAQAGVRLSGSSTCIVRDNRMSYEGENASDASAVAGLSIDNGSDHNQILRNVAVRSKSSGISLGTGAGGPCTDNLLQGNDVSWAVGSGIVVKGQTGNNVNGNIASHCDKGILLSGVSNSGIKNNLVVGNVQYGVEDDGGSMNAYESNTFAQDDGSAVALFAKGAAGGHANLRLFQNTFVDYQRPLLIDNASPLTMQSNVFVGAPSIDIADLADVKGQGPLALDNQTDTAKGGKFVASVGSLSLAPSVFDHVGGVSVAALLQKDAEVVVEGSLTGAFQGEEEVLARYKGDTPVDLTFPPRTVSQVRIKGVPQIPAAFLMLLGDHSMASQKDTTDDVDAVSSPNEAIDGDWTSPNHGWQPKKGAAGEWWQVDLKRSVAITSFAVMADPSKPTGFYGKFHIQVSDTGFFKGEETTVITETNWNSRPGAMHVYKCSPVQARYVRLVGDVDQAGVRLAQFGVYGADH